MQHYLLIKTYPQWHCAHNPLFYCWPNLQVLLRLPRRRSRRWMVPPRPMYIYVYVLYLLYVGLIYQSESHVYEQKGIGPGYWIYVYVQLYTSMIYEQQCFI